MATRRDFLVGMTATGLAPALFACGEDDSSQRDGRPDERDFSSTRIEHRYGTTTIERPPERVAVVGLIEQDMLLALGVAPIAVRGTKVAPDAAAEGRIYPWARPAFDATGADLPAVLSGVGEDIAIEQVAATEPDLIIGIESAIEKGQYEMLSQIAPTIARPKEYPDYGVPWDEMTRIVARAVGRVPQGAAVVAQVDQRLRREAAKNAALFRGARVPIAVSYEGLGFFGPEDARARILARLGMEYPVPVRDMLEGDPYRSVSAENAADLLAGLDGVIWLVMEPRRRELDTIWKRTDTAREGRFVDISQEDDGLYSFAHGFVTPLSIPWVLDRYIPQLVAMLDGDPATRPPAAPGGDDERLSVPVPG